MNLIVGTTMDTQVVSLGLESLEIGLKEPCTFKMLIRKTLTTLEVIFSD